MATIRRRVLMLRQLTERRHAGQPPPSPPRALRRRLKLTVTDDRNPPLGIAASRGERRAQ